MNTQEILYELLKCSGTTTREYAESLVAALKDDLVNCIGINDDSLDIVTRIVLEEALQIIKEGKEAE